GLLTSSRERAALRIDHRLDLRSSLLVVALKGISNDHASLPAVSYNHALDRCWFMVPDAPPRSRQSRHKPGACGRAGIRLDSRRRDRWRRTASVIRAGEPPCAARVFPVTQPIVLAFACPSRAAPRPRSADWSSRLWQQTARAPWAPYRPCAPAPDRCAPARR